jgi:Peptidase family M28
VSRNRGLVWCLLGITVLSVLTALAYRLPSPHRDVAVDAFSAYRAQTQLKSLVGDAKAHPLGSEANAWVRATIVQRLSALGYETQIQSGFVCNSYAICGTPSNIIARLPRMRQSAAANANANANANATGADANADVDVDADADANGDLVLLAAHYDSVPAGPGASDDAVGVAAVLEIARILAVMPPTRHPIALLISDGEEAGLLGAQLFVRDQPMAKHVVAAVNLEARGSSGPSLMFETGSANSWLMSLYRSTVARPITDSVYYVAYKSLPNSTDFSVFKSADWQGFNFAFIGDVGHYHTALDTFENADLRSIQHHGDNALACVLALADSDHLRSQPALDAVYFDVLSRLLIAWPAPYSLAAASATLVLLLVEALLLQRSRRLRVQQIAWGALGAAACVVFAGIASGAALALLLAAGKVPPIGQYSWIAHPAWMHMACAALAAAAAGISGHWLSKRAGFWGFWFGAVLLLAVLAEVQAVLLPGTGFVSLVPTAVAALAALPSLRTLGARTTAHTGLMDLAALAPAWVMFALLLPLISLLYGALGSVAWIIDTLQFALAATLLLPLLAAASVLLRRRIIAVAVLAAVLGVLITLALPTYSAAWPQRVNFRYRLDATLHQAVWLTEADSLQLPPYAANAAPFDGVSTLETATGRSRAFAAPAPWNNLAPPLLTLRSTRPGPAGTTRYDVHLQSMRAAPELELSFPAGAQIREMIWKDASGERHIPLYETQNGMTRLFLVGFPSQGMDFAIDVRGTSLEASMFDQSYGLPGGEFLQRARPQEATSSQDGDTTIVQNTVVLDPAAGR